MSDQKNMPGVMLEKGQRIGLNGIGQLTQILTTETPSVGGQSIDMLAEIRPSPPYIEVFMYKYFKKIILSLL